ncbi:MAG: type II toxin-antitoxin system prevent-host-death family antitoxin [Alphaproteobacteria bacterium]|nr:type II toxin-antitoxin system prevent-host-death family antitoxin [Alphaproteobacteria bacterium]
MIRVTVSEVKNSLSAYLRRVRAGETVLVLDRTTPVARIVPVGGGTDKAGDDARIARLERAGTLSRRSAESPLTALEPPVRTDAGILDALLEERFEERREGSR